MRPGLLVTALVAAGLAALAPAASQEPFAGGADLDLAADANRGRFIAIGGEMRTLRISCVQCHGLDGSGSTSGAFPRLAGLGGWYLYKALADYKAGRRPNRVMAPIAETLTDAEMRDVAAYYASLEEPPPPPPPEADYEVVQVGGALSAVGAPEAGVPACSGCHGARGMGLEPIVPRLAGQYAAYLEHQLQLWKQGRRDGDAMNVMERIAKAMTDEQIRAAALYFASIGVSEPVPDPEPEPVAVELPSLIEPPPSPYLDEGADVGSEAR